MHDLLEKLQDDLYHINDAIEALTGIDGYEDVIEEIEARRMPIEERIEEIEALIAEQDKRDLEDLTREYWRSVI